MPDRALVSGANTGNGGLMFSAISGVARRALHGSLWVNFHPLQQAEIGNFRNEKNRTKMPKVLNFSSIRTNSVNKSGEPMASFFGSVLWL
jgi:hypothetical protein